MTSILSVANHHNFKQCLASTVALLLFWQWGICQGFSAMLIPQLQEAESPISISVDQLSWLASLFPLLMPCGSLIIGTFMEIYGRKKALQLAFLLIMTGWTIMYAADTVLILYIGRAITGIASGMDPATLVYITETNTPSVRVVMLALGPPIVIAGNLVSYMIGNQLPWREATLVYIVFGVISLAATFCIPESPVWQVTKGDTAGALRSLKRLRSTKDLEGAKAELADLQSAHKASSPDNEDISYFSRIVATKAWKPFFILELLFILQQVSGYNVTVYYSTDIFKQFDTPIDESFSSIVYMAMGLVSVILFVFIVERVNRKTLCIWSSLGVCLSCLSVAAYSYLLDGVQDKPWYWFPVVGYSTSVVFGSLGLFSVPWILPAELFPGQVRGFMCGLLLSSVYIWTFACVKLYPTIVSWISIHGVLLIFAGAAGVAVIFSKFVLPETRGKTLTEIEQFW